MSRNTRVLTICAMLAIIATLVPAPDSLAQPGAPDHVDRYGEAGLISLTEYQSPHHGYGVEWTHDWGIDDGQDLPVLFQGYQIDVHQDVPVYSDSGTARDRIDLWNEDASARIRVIGQPVGPNTMSPHVEFLTNGVTNQAVGGNTTTVLSEFIEDNRLAVVHRHDLADGSQWLSYNEIPLLEGGETWVWIQVTARVDAFEAALDQALSGLTVDGDPRSAPYTAGETLEAAEAAPPVVDFAEFGVMSATTYSSPQYGFEVEWASDWSLYGGVGTSRNTDSNSENGWDTLYLRPLYGDPSFTLLSIHGEPNPGNLSLDEVMLQMRQEYAEDEREVLLSEHDGATGVILVRKVWDDGSGAIDYVEVSLSGDGEGVIEAGVHGTLDEFPWEFERSVAAVSIDGQTFGEYFSVEEVIAASEGTAALPAALIPADFEAYRDMTARSAEIVDNYGDAGMVFANEYLSPTYGYRLLWGSGWVVDEQAEVPAVTSDDEGNDTLLLRNSSTESRLEVRAAPIEGANVDSLIETLETACSEAEAPSCEVMMTERQESRGGVIVREVVDEHTVVVTYYGFTLIEGGDAALWVTLSSSEQMFNIAYGYLADAMAMDGDPIWLAFDKDEVPNVNVIP